MDKKRREFIKWFGISTLATLTCTTVPNKLVYGNQGVKDYPSLKDSSTTEARWGMIFDLRKFKADPSLADRATQVCHSLHNVPNFTSEDDRISWIEMTSFLKAFGYTSPDYSEVPVICNNCANPPCVQNCPTRATFKNSYGIVIVDYHRCIGCRLCVSACPYDARKFNSRNPREGIATINTDYPTRCQGVVENCNYCSDRIYQGMNAGCIEATSEANAIIMGDLNDPSSEINLTLQNNTTIRRKTELGTNPSVYYIV